MRRHRALSVCALTLAASTGLAQHAYNPLPLRSVMNDDVRVVWMGDSFAAPWHDRVSGAMLMTWPIRDWTSFTIHCGPSWFFADFDELDPGIGTVDATNLYRLFDTGPDAGSGERFALPLWKMREWHGGPGETPLLDVSYREVTRYSAVDDFAELNDTIRLTPLMFDPPGDRPIAAQRFDAAGGSITVDPADAPAGGPDDGRVWRAPSSLELTAEQGGRWSFRVSAVGEGYAHRPGFTMERLSGGVRAPGLNWTYLADNSWSYEAFGLGLPAGPGTPTKTFSREQLAAWLGASSVDDEMPVFVFYYLAVESTEQAAFADQLREMVEQTEAAAGDAGLGPTHHCFVLPHFHAISYPDGRRLVPSRFTETRDAAMAYAATRDDMSVLSIYDYSDGVLFDGSPDANQWLTDHGFDNLVYGERTLDLVNGNAQGRLLDGGDLHPANKGALAFAWMAAQIVIDACPADFAAPYGVLDLYDIDAFGHAFLNEPYRADIADPRGVLDLYDIDRYVDSFIAGCDG